MMSRRTTSDTWTFFQDDWHPGNHPIMGPRTHAAWLGSSVFDGARVFDGAAPDLEMHFARVNVSAAKFLLEPRVPIETWTALTLDGLTRFAPADALYVRPMYWPERGAAGGGVRFDPASTQWCLCLYLAAMPSPTGISITLSPFRRPSIETAPVESKAGCLYPNGSRALIEAFRRGFDNCVMCDMLGNVAELANSNIFLVTRGVVKTPLPNGTFLDGITRRRVIELLEANGVVVIQTTLRYKDFESADEIFATGNFAKLTPVTRIESRSIQIGPIFRAARELYWEFAHSCRVGEPVVIRGNTYSRQADTQQAQFPH